MSQQAPKLVSNTHYCVVGDVLVDPSAVIAPGVVLQASSGSRLVIGRGVCLAAGVCIQSRQGVLTISEGVSLGANVLVIGSGEIGANACVSAGSTLINPTVSAEALLPPDTLIETAIQSASSDNGFAQNGFSSNSSHEYSSFQTYHSASSSSVQSSYQSEHYQSAISYDRVYGREQVSKLISALFPNRPSSES